MRWRHRICPGSSWTSLQLVFLFSSPRFAVKKNANLRHRVSNLGAKLCFCYLQAAKKERELFMLLLQRCDCTFFFLISIWFRCNFVGAPQRTRRFRISTGQEIIVDFILFEVAIVYIRHSWLEVAIASANWMHACHSFALVYNMKRCVYIYIYTYSQS